MAKLKFEIPLDPEVVLDILTSAHDANACNYFLMEQPPFLSADWYDKMKADPKLWKTFEWQLLVDDGSDKGEEQTITFARMCFGLQKMLTDEIKGKYKNPWTRVTDVVGGRDYGDSVFAQEVIQYAMYGKVIFG